jgi:hypothetical protein
MTINSATFRTPSPLPAGSVIKITLEATGADSNYGADIKTMSVTVPPPPPPPQVPVPTPIRRRDPLAQTIETSNSDLFVAAVELYFSAKPATDTASAPNSSTPSSRIRVQLVEVENGFPTARVLTNGEASIDEVALVSTTDFTSFNFPGPVYLKRNSRYAIVVITESPDYLVWTAKVGGTIDGTNDLQGVQAYPAGVLQQSADRVSWAPIFDTDLTFRLKCIKYSPEKTIEFAPVSCPDSIGFRFEPTFLLPDDPTNNAETACEIRWSYKLDADTVWQAFEPYSDIFPGEVFDQVKFQLFMRSTGNNATRVTPVVSLNSPANSLTTYKRGLYTQFPSKTMTMATAYRYVRMIVKQTQASACTWYVSDNTPSTAATVWTSGTDFTAGALATNDGKTWLALLNSGPGNGGHQTPAQGSYWTEADTVDSVVWRLVPSTDEVVTPVGNGVFEHERNLDLGFNSGRTQFRYMLKQQVGSVEETATPPTCSDVICILNA